MNSTIIYYTDPKRCDYKTNGFPILNADSPKIQQFAYAAAHINKQNKYYLKYHNARFINPNSMYDVDFKKMVDSSSVWKWKEVTEEVFKLYINFLKTGLSRFLSQAERGLL